MNSLSERLQYLAGLKKMRQADIARAIGTSPSTVNKWWNGVRPPDDKYTADLAELFKCEIKWLRDGVGEKPTKYQSYDMSGSGNYQIENKAQGDIAQGNITKGGFMELTPVEQSLINLNRAMGNEENLKNWINELTNPSK